MPKPEVDEAVLDDDDQLDDEDDQEPDDAEDGDDEGTGDGTDTDDDDDDDDKGKPKAPALSRDQKRDLDFVERLRRRDPNAVEEARKHLKQNSDKRPAESDDDAPLTRREYEENERRKALTAKAEKLTGDLETLRKSDRYKGIIKDSDVDEVLDLAWDKGLTVRQAVKLIDRFDTRRKNRAKKKRKQEDAPAGGSGGKSGGRKRGGKTSIEQLSKAAKGKGSGSPERIALQKARIEESRARTKKK